MPIIIGEFVQSLEEESMSAKERNELEDDDFGIPELRKYPIHNKKHVNQAIKMFNHVEKKYEFELADNLLDAMERFHISTDTVGEKNRLRKYIKENVVTEGFISNNETPREIKVLYEKLKDILKTNDIPNSVDDVIDVVGDTVKGKDFSGEEKKYIYKVCKKVGIDIKGYTITSNTIKGIKINNNHKVLGTYKDYILSLKFLGTKGIIKLQPFGIAIHYDKNKTNIPKNVAFDVLDILSPNVDKVKTHKTSIKISALSKSIDDGFPRISHKYSNKYYVKKSVSGFSITISNKYFIRENAIAGALPRQDYQPDAVYVVNYMMKNTFVEDLAICKDKMSSIFVCKDGKPIHMSLTDFNEMATDVKMYKCLTDTDFDHILKSSNCGLDFYKNIVNEEVNIKNLDSDYRFIKVSSYLDELNAIKECIINSAPKSGFVHEIYCPMIPLMDLNEEGSVIHYYRDINGVFAQNINTLHRSASYKSVEDISESVLKILSNM